MAATLGSSVEQVAAALGVSYGHVMFVIVCLLASLLTIPMSRSKCSRRHPAFHLYSVAPGVVFLFLMCGSDAWLVILQAALGYVAIRVCGPRVCHLVVFVEAMLILAFVHLRRLMNNVDDSFDVSSPLMISTMKLTSLAFGIHDAHCPHQEKEKAHLRRRTHNDVASQSAHSSSAGQQPPQHHLVHDVPSLAVYLDYLFYFQGVLIGPPCFFPEFLDYLNSREERPSRKGLLIKNLFLSLFYAFVYLSMKPIFPTEHNKDPSVFLQWSFFYRMWHAITSCFIWRFKFYCGWTIGETLQVAAGLGFNSTTRQWNKLCNIYPLQVELATSPKSYIDAWNLKTNEWLRYLAYHRLSPNLSIVSTFVLSAVWHGFYPGYYFAFLFAVPMTLASRKLRRCLRPWFVLCERRKRFYDVLTWVSTQIAMTSLFMPFILLNFTDTFIFYTYNQYWWFQIATLVILVLPLPNLQ